nr:hypothetical protein [uncultured Campylobacter sp.]
MLSGATALIKARIKISQSFLKPVILVLVCMVCLLILRLLYKILAELILKDALKMRYLGGHNGARAVLI